MTFSGLVLYYGVLLHQHEVVDYVSHTQKL